MRFTQYWLAFVLLAAFAAPAFAQEDPCVGLDSDPTASATQWLECFRTVPFDDAVRHNILDGIEDNLRNWTAFPPAYKAGALAGGTQIVIFQDLLGPGSFLRTHAFQSEYDFHAAVITRFVAPLQNRHNYYFGPTCYHTVFWNPLTLSSTARFGGEQIIFVDEPTLSNVFDGLEDMIGTPFVNLGGLGAAGYYAQVAGGPDVTPFVGLKVVSINGIDAMDFVRAYGDRLNHSSNPSNRFNEALRAVNSRSMGPFRLDLPLLDDALQLEYVFQDRSGRRIGPVSIPLKPLSVLPGEGPAPVDSDSFAAVCTVPSPFTLVDDTQAPSPPAALSARNGKAGPLADDEHDSSGPASQETPALNPLAASPHEAPHLRRDQHLLKAAQSMQRTWRMAGSPKAESDLRRRSPENTSGRFFDMPPGGPGPEVQVVVERPYDFNLPISVIRAYQVDDEAVAIEIPSWSSDLDWLEGVADGINHACSIDAEYLIFDLRRFPGGAAAASTLLSFILFEEDQSRINARDPLLNFDYDGPSQLPLQDYIASLFQQGDLVRQLTGGAIEVVFDPTDQLNLDGTFNTPDVYVDRVLRDYGQGVTAPYTAPFFPPAYDSYPPDFTFPVNQCPGRFSGRRLIILDDGNAGSAGPIWTKQIRDRATVVTTGGDLASGVPTSMGQRLGGGVISWRSIAAVHEFLVALSGGFIPGLPALPAAPEYPLMRAPLARAVDMEFELFQSLVSPDSDELTRASETPADAVIETWTARLKRGTDLERYGYVYGKTLQAVRSLKD